MELGSTSTVCSQAVQAPRSAAAAVRTASGASVHLAGSGSLAWAGGAAGSAWTLPGSSHELHGLQLVDACAGRHPGVHAAAHPEQGQAEPDHQPAIKQLERQRQQRKNEQLWQPHPHLDLADLQGIVVLHAG